MNINTHRDTQNKGNKLYTSMFFLSFSLNGLRGPISANHPLYTVDKFYRSLFFSRFSFLVSKIFLWMSSSSSSSYYGHMYLANPSKPWSQKPDLYLYQLYIQTENILQRSVGGKDLDSVYICSFYYQYFSKLATLSPMFDLNSQNSESRSSYILKWLRLRNVDLN